MPNLTLFRGGGGREEMGGRDENSKKIRLKNESSVYYIYPNYLFHTYFFYAEENHVKRQHEYKKYY